MGAAGSNPRWWTLLLEGLLAIMTGVIAFVWPGLTALMMVYLVASWAVVTGILGIAAAVRLRNIIEGEWLMGLAGAASVVLGMMLFAWPASGALLLVWLIGSYMLIFGALLLGLAL